VRAKLSFHRAAAHRAPALLAAAVVLVLIAAGCGGGGSSSSGGNGSMTKDEVVAKVESACQKASAYAVWLPEHLKKTHKTANEGTLIMRRADDEFRASLKELDPPEDLRKPLEALEKYEPSESDSSLAKLKASLKERAALYEEVGADRCAEGLQASLLTIDGASVEEAFEKVGLPLPARPAGW
jgi:hypothetical protein